MASILQLIETLILEFHALNVNVETLTPEIKILVADIHTIVTRLFPPDPVTGLTVTEGTPTVRP
jgi:hypothetical protein